MTKYADITIDTFSGTFFHVFDPREDEINITDIAHALSNLCRFTGQCDPFYSVADRTNVGKQNVRIVINALMKLIQEVPAAGVKTDGTK